MLREIDSRAACIMGIFGEIICNGIQITAGNQICVFLALLTTNYSVVDLVKGCISCHIVGLDAIM